MFWIGPLGLLMLLKHASVWLPLMNATKPGP
jgi:hypothetical protein